MSRYDLSASVERMRRRLKAVESIAMSALCNQPEGTFDCWQHLSRAQGQIYDLLAVGWKKLVDDAEYRTPKAALDVVMADPPMETIAGDRPLDKLLMQPVGESGVGV